MRTRRSCFIVIDEAHLKGLRRDLLFDLAVHLGKIQCLDSFNIYTMTFLTKKRFLVFKRLSYYTVECLVSETLLVTGICLKFILVMC